MDERTIFVDEFQDATSKDGDWLKSTCALPSLFIFFGTTRSFDRLRKFADN
jgi:hypothetical protein